MVVVVEGVAVVAAAAAAVVVVVVEGLEEVVVRERVRKRLRRMVEGRWDGRERLVGIGGLRAVSGSWVFVGSRDGDG